MQKLLLVIVVAILAGCQTNTAPKRETYDLISAEMRKAAQVSTLSAPPDAVAAALLPPLQIEMPKVRQPLEERFSLTFNNVPAQQFFMALVTGTRYNMLIHPEVTGTISANLKDVTLFEALDAIRELYGYDYKVDGTRIVIKPLTMQTRVFQVNYLTGNRKGTSDTSVISSSVSDVGSTSNGSRNNNNNYNNNNNNGNNNNDNRNNGQGGAARSLGSKVITASTSDFWTELKAALDAIVGSDKDGRSIVISPQSGVVVVRAMPEELKNVAEYLKATQLSVDRQVILEAKILEVELNDSFQSGVNWAAFRGGSHSNRGSIGFMQPGSSLAPSGVSNVIGADGVTAAVGQTMANAAANTMFGLAFQTANFAAMINFLETQGTVHVLSSPRIATLNNQKAVLKVGTDEFFVTEVTSTTTTTGSAATTTPSVTLQPFFSGVVLDVTPQIDDRGNVILHIHPSVSQVSQVDKAINLGSMGGAVTLPLASSNTSETDSVVRGQDGQIVAIGGLMRQSSTSDREQVPGLNKVPVAGELFKNTRQSTQKRELVILLKPTVVQGSASWTRDILESQQRIQDLEPRNTLGQ